MMCCVYVCVGVSVIQRRRGADKFLIISANRVTMENYTYTAKDKGLIIVGLGIHIWVGVCKYNTRLRSQIREWPR